MGDTYTGVCKKCKRETDLIDGICANCSIKRGGVKERKIHEWEVSDEYGWRMVELWEIDGELELFATNKDGGEVEPRV